MTLALLPTPAPTVRYHRDDVRAVMDANRPKLLAIAEVVAAVTSSLDLTTTPQGKSDKPATEPRKVA